MAQKTTQDEEFDHRNLQEAGQAVLTQQLTLNPSSAKISLASKV
jgi:hypothetical protein